MGTTGTIFLTPLVCQVLNPGPPAREASTRLSRRLDVDSNFVYINDQSYKNNFLIGYFLFMDCSRVCLNYFQIVLFLIDML